MWFRKKRIQRKRKPDPKYEATRGAARAFILERVAFWQERCEVVPKRITIRNQRRRWGCCSSKGNLNFNYRLLFIPPELSDYVIVHELCHLKELNHSPAFWREVEKVLPNYRELVIKLRGMEGEAFLKRMSLDL